MYSFCMRGEGKALMKENGQNCEIWVKLCNLVEIVEFGQNCEILQEL